MIEQNPIDESLLKKTQRHWDNLIQENQPFRYRGLGHAGNTVATL